MATATGILFLLDTNVVSELRTVRRCDSKVRAWQERTPAGDCSISVVTLLEIRSGIEKVRRRDPDFAAALESWFDRQVKPAFSERCVPVTPAVAERAGRISSGRTRALSDCLIAATALEHNLTLATRNVADFEDVDGLALCNPWDG